MSEIEYIKSDEPEIIVLNPEEEDILKNLDILSEWLDNKFIIPGTSIRFGIDSLIGLIPVVGDSLTTIVSGYIIKEAHKLNAPMNLKFLMGWNVFVDWFGGLLPIVGDIFDIGWKANSKNVKLLKDYIKKNK